MLDYVIDQLDLKESFRTNANQFGSWASPAPVNGTDGVRAFQLVTYLYADGVNKGAFITSVGRVIHLGRWLAQNLGNDIERVTRQ